MTNGNYEQLKAKFLKAYANVPEDERAQPIILIDRKTYNWNTAFDEITADTELGRSIIIKMHDVGLL